MSHTSVIAVPGVFVNPFSESSTDAYALTPDRRRFVWRGRWWALAAAL